jgi:hypothetical protein
MRMPEQPANIGPKGQRQRRQFGLQALVLSVVLFAALYALGTGRGWRVLLFAPLFIAGLGLFQAMDKT